jgi:predicted dehydrogenase
MKTYMAGIVGTGRIAGYLEDDPLRDHPCTHAGTFRRMSEVSLVSCAGKSLDSSIRFALKFDIPYCYSSLEDMLKNQELDILSVCTPAELHVPFTIAAAESGKVRAVFCEKALGLSLREAERAVTVCRERNVPLVVNYLRRWSGDYVTVKHLIASGAIGRVQTVQSVFSGHIMHTGSHMFDLLYHFFGMPEWVEARLDGFQDAPRGDSGYKFCEDDHFDDPSGTAFLRFPGDIDVSVSGMGKNYFIFEMDIIGSRGRIRIGNFLKELWLSEQSDHYSGFRELRRAAFSVPPRSRNAWFAAVEDIISQLKGGPCAGASGEDACRSMEIAFGMLISSRYGGARVAYPLQERDCRILSR